MFSDHNGIKLEISKISGLPRYLGIKHFKKKKHHNLCSRRRWDLSGVFERQVGFERTER